MEFILSHNLSGILIGLTTFLIIGLFHPLVIKAEFYFGTRVWWLFLVAGIVFIAGSFFVENIILSAMCGVTGFSSLWSIIELFQQKIRVEKGWFPRNPKRKS